MKNKNILQILEAHVDKIILAVFVLIGLALLGIYVIGNPYGQKIRIRGQEKKIGPPKIDLTVNAELERALPKLQEPAEPEPPNPDYISQYNKLVMCSLSGVSSTAKIPMPGEGEVVEEERLYVLPVIPPLINVNREALRGAAKIPTEEVGPDRAYKSAAHEIGDIDLVTVSARFDVRALMNNFQQSFMGPRLKTSWKEEEYAVPVFARIELQRRSQLQDGSWEQWETVSRTDTDPYRTLLEELPSSLEQSQLGVGHWMSQLKIDEIQIDIVQPEPYAFTISRLDWMAPDYLVEARDILDKEEEDKRREELEDKRDSRTRKTNPRRPTTPKRPAPNRSNRGRDFGPEAMMGMDPTRTARKPAQKERTVDDVEKDFEKERLVEEFVIGSFQEPLLVWAHDDSLKPGSVYQYRVRIGVFNPIAGKDWFTSEQAEYKDQLVLWSDYSQPTTALEIPSRFYMFPMEVIADKDPESKPKGIRVEVAKYHLGRWRDFDFDVFPGEIIGYEVEDKEENRNPDMAEDYGMMAALSNVEDKLVDFSTDNILVDILNEISRGSRFQSISFHSMLVSDSEDQMLQLPVGKRNWHSDTRNRYAVIQKEIDSGFERRGGMEGYDEMDPMMMDMEMMMMMQ